MPRLNQIEVLRLFSRHQVPVVVVGGHAVLFHGYQRMTEDIDVIWQRSPDTEMLLLNALKELNAQWITSEIDPATRIEKLAHVNLPYIRSSHLMMLFTDGGFIDLFDYIPGHPLVDVREVFETAEEQDGLRFASLNWLRKMKLAAGRAKDLEDLRELDALPPQE